VMPRSFVLSMLGKDKLSVLERYQASHRAAERAVAVFSRCAGGHV
jgi:hypothetical protein